MRYRIFQVSEAERVKPLLSVERVIEYFSSAVFSITFMGKKKPFLA
jgi:hypothetical protein